jgi:hypothetical protein
LKLFNFLKHFRCPEVQPAVMNVLKTADLYGSGFRYSHCKWGRNLRKFLVVIKEYLTFDLEAT